MIQVEKAEPAKSEPVIREIDLASIRLDQSAQPRESLNTDKTAEYSEAMGQGDKFPPLVVFFDGVDHWLADGFHRHYAAQQAKRVTFLCKVFDGGLRDAILYSVGANAKHGLARSDEDKRRAVMRLLADEEWSGWSDREIARRCRVSDKFVAKQRPPVSADDPQIKRKVQRGGTVYTQKVAKAAVSRAPEPATPEAIEAMACKPETLETPAADFATQPSAELDAATIQSAWDHAGEPGRALFLTANNLTESNQATGMGGEDVDRSASRASSAVQLGATNSPERANELLGGLPVPATEVNVERTGRTPAYARTGRHGTPHVSGVTGGESAAINSELDGGAFVAVKGKARLANADSVEPSLSNAHSVPASSQATEQTGAVPVIPAAPVAPITPAHVPGHSLDREPVANEPAPGALAGACNITRSNTIGRTPPAPISKEPKLNPDCLKAARGEACFLSHSAASCSKCASAATKARKAA